MPGEYRSVKVQDVIDVANFYDIESFCLFYLAYLWFYLRMPDYQVLKRDYFDFIIERKIPVYVKQFVIENPLVEDNGLIAEEWLPVLEALRCGDPEDIYKSSFSAIYWSLNNVALEK